MASEELKEERPALDYRLCNYGESRLQFRGPQCDLTGPYIAVLGGAETFGRYVEHPFPELMQEWLGTPVANLGVQQAGPSLFGEERWLLEVASKAEVAVLQVLGAQNMSNRLYSVHTRRNDRFLAVSPALREMFPEVDFSEINFTGHLLTTLAERSSVAFDVLVEELKWAWILRMRRIVNLIQTDVILLWVSDHTPDEAGQSESVSEPTFVDRAMLDALGSDIAGLVEVVDAGGSQEERLSGKVFEEGEEEAALMFPGADQHTRMAELLVEAIGALRDAPGPQRSQARA